MQEIKLLFSNKLRDSSGFTLRMTVLKPSHYIFYEIFSANLCQGVQRDRG
ncbi:MAG: hypothetical protein HY813_01705 [Candidatus Portnoybacteria bacterium]|nr:hypothetical protein [Candidatus Portnoybacteria bacterium]